MRFRRSASETEYIYEWRTGAVQKQIKHYEDVHLRTSSDIDDTVFTLNANGETTKADIDDGQSREVDYINDLSGQVIRREVDLDANNTDPTPLETWHRFGGKQMGYEGNNGTEGGKAVEDNSQTFVQTHNNASILTRSTYGGIFRHGLSTEVDHDDFDQSYQALNSYNQGSTAGTYTVRGGETLASIAAGLYGDSNLWYKIAEANGLSASANLTTGTTLRLPAGVIRNTNNAGTFTPYNPGDAIGDVSPTAPEPPKDSKDCGAFGQVMMAIVAVSVTIMTGSPVLGNIASQGVGIITGIQDKFSFKSLGMAYITAGLNKLNVGAKVAQAVGAKSALSQAVVGGAINSAAAQGIGVATGLQDKFSWSGVAAAGIGAGIGHVVGDALPGSAGYTADENGIFNVTSKASFGNSVISNTAGAIANAATRSALDGTNFGDNVVAAIPDVVGQTFGGLLGNDLSGAFGDLGPISDIIGGINSLTNFVYNQAETVGNEIAGVIGSLGRSGGSNKNHYNEFSEFQISQIYDRRPEIVPDPKGTAGLEAKNSLDEKEHKNLTMLLKKNIRTSKADDGYDYEYYIATDEQLEFIEDRAGEALDLYERGLKLVEKYENNRWSLTDAEQRALQAYRPYEDNSSTFPMYEVPRLKKILSDSVNELRNFTNDSTHDRLIIGFSDLPQSSDKVSKGLRLRLENGGNLIIFEKDYIFNAKPLYKSKVNNPGNEIYTEQTISVGHEVGLHIGAGLISERVMGKLENQTNYTETVAHTHATDAFLTRIYRFNIY